MCRSGAGPGAAGAGPALQEVELVPPHAGREDRPVVLVVLRETAAIVVVGDAARLAGRPDPAGADERHAIQQVRQAVRDVAELRQELLVVEGEPLRAGGDLAVD